MAWFVFLSCRRYGAIRGPVVCGLLGGQALPFGKKVEPAGRLRWPWAYHPAGGGGAGWRGARTAKCALCREQLSFAPARPQQQAAPSPVPLRQRRRKETQRPTPSVCASFITDYRPCAQACVIYYFPPAHPAHCLLLQQQRRSSAALFAAAAWGGLGRRRRQSSRSPTPAPFCRARTRVRREQELS